MVVETPFATVGQADNAYFGSGDGSDEDSGDSSSDGEWGPLQESDTLGSGWVLAFQNQEGGDRQRWFVIRSLDGQLQALQSSGEPYNAKDSDTLAELPHYPTEDDARAAFEAWAEENDGEEQPGDDEWGEWQRIRQVDPWWVFSRSHQTEDRAQFLLAGKRQDGSTVYLAPGAALQDEPHIYDSTEAMQSALDAYFRAVQNGDIPEDGQPTGDAPSRTEVNEAVRESSQSVEHMVERLAGQKVLLGLVGVGAVYVYYSQQEGSLA